MKISNVVKEAVASKDIVSIRNGLWTCINIDPSFSDYCPDNFDYCLKNGITEEMLYEPHDSRLVDLEITEDNFALLVGQLRTNFSKERINKIKEMGKKLYPASTDSSSTSENKNNSSSSGVKRTSVRRESSSTKESASQMGSIIAISAIIVVVVIILALILKK